MTPEQLKLHFEYDPLTGIVTRHTTGLPTGTVNGNGYVVVRVARKTLQAHRMAVALMTGEWPPRNRVVDHINGNRTDNKWCNLRVIPQSQNTLTRRLGLNNKSGRRGVCWNKVRGRWEVSIKRLGKKVHVGLFDDLEQADAAFKAASKTFADLRTLSEISKGGFDLVSAWKDLRLEKSLTC